MDGEGVEIAHRGEARVTWVSEFGSPEVSLVFARFTRDDEASARPRRGRSRPPPSARLARRWAFRVLRSRGKRPPVDDRDRQGPSAVARALFEDLTRLLRVEIDPIKIF